LRSFPPLPISSLRDRAPLTIDRDRDVGPHRCAWGFGLTRPPAAQRAPGRASTSEEQIKHHRIWRLRNLHRKLKQLIREEECRAKPDALILRDLKRRKLQVKDELSMAEAGLVPVTTRMGHG
jgi:hypothetical protein